MGKRFAAYLYLFIAGNATAWLAVGLIDGHGLLRSIAHPHWDDVPLLVLPGMAAVIAAGMVHVPFLRAARAGRGAALYGWTFLGVLLAHVAYTALVFAHGLFREPPEEALRLGVLFGVTSVTLGLLPNLLLGMGFAKAAMWLGKDPRGAYGEART